LRLVASNREFKGRMQNSKDFIVNKGLAPERLLFHPDSSGKKWFFDPEDMLKAVLKTNADLEFQIKWHIEQRELGVVLILDNIPDKNRSGGIGECLGQAYCMIVGGVVKKNPHESGSPDFFPVVKESMPWFKEPKKDTYTIGGFDTKGVKIQNSNFTGAKASSHHTQTSSPLVVAWRYFDEIPQIIGVYYTNEMDEKDWKIGSIPQDNGSKPTSSARLLNTGIDKLRKGWMILHKSIVLPSKKEDVERYNLEGVRLFQENEREKETVIN
jgi:hypothetical protein